MCLRHVGGLWVLYLACDRDFESLPKFVRRSPYPERDNIAVYKRRDVEQRSEMLPFCESLFVAYRLQFTLCAVVFCGLTCYTVFDRP